MRSTDILNSSILAIMFCVAFLPLDSYGDSLIPDIEKAVREVPAALSVDVIEYVIILDLLSNFDFTKSRAAVLMEAESILSSFESARLEPARTNSCLAEVVEARGVMQGAIAEFGTSAAAEKGAAKEAALTYMRDILEQRYSGTGAEVLQVDLVTKKEQVVGLLAGLEQLNIDFNGLPDLDLVPTAASLMSSDHTPPRRLEEIKVGLERFSIDSKPKDGMLISEEEILRVSGLVAQIILASLASQDLWGFSDVFSRLGEYALQLQECSSALDSVLRQIFELRKSDLRIVENKASLLKGRIDQLDRDISGLMEKQRELERGARKIVKSKSTLDDLLSDLTNRVDRLERTDKTLRSDAVDLKGEIEGIEEELESIREKSRPLSDDDKEREALLEDELSQKKTALGSKQRQVAANAKALKSSAQKKQKKTEALEEIVGALDVARREIAKVNSAIDRSMENLSDERKRLADARREQSVLRGELDRIRERRAPVREFQSKMTSAQAQVQVVEERMGQIVTRYKGQKVQQVAILPILDLSLELWGDRWKLVSGLYRIDELLGK